MAGEKKFRPRLVSAPGGVYAGRQSIFKVTMLQAGLKTLDNKEPTT